MELDQKKINEKNPEVKISRKEALKKVGITALAANSLMFLQTNALACGSAGGCSGSGGGNGGTGCGGGGNGMGMGGNGQGGSGQGGGGSETGHVPGGTHETGEEYETEAGHVPGAGSKKPDGKGKKPEDDQHTGDHTDHTG